MEAVIIYLTIRIIALAVFVFISKLTDGTLIASFVSTTICLVAFVLHIYHNALRWHKKHTSRLWQDVCPFAVRNRLPLVTRAIENTNKSGESRPKLSPMWLSEVYIFALLPVSSNILNWILIKTTFHTVGSLKLVQTLNRSLIVAWAYRLFERWGIDGCLPVFYCEKKINQSRNNGNNLHVMLWTALAALLSPTCVLHFWTGVTLIAAYCHSRTVEIFILTKLIS